MFATPVRPSQRRRSRRTALTATATAALALALLAGNGPVSYGATAASAVAACDQPDPALTVSVPAGGDIQSAVDEVADAGGGCVDLAAGTWTLAQSLQMRTGVALNGSGTATLLQGPSAVYDYPLITLTGPEPRSGVIVENMKLDGRIPASALTTDPDADNPYSGALGIYFAAFTYDDQDILVKNVEIANTAMGIHIKGAEGVTLDSDYLHENGIAYWLHNSYLRRVTDVLITHCRMDGSLIGTGLHVAGTSSGITIEDSEFNGNAAHGVNIQDQPQDVALSGDTFDDNDGDGIRATGDNLVIDGNTTLGNSADGIHTLTGTGSVTHNTSSGNGGLQLDIHGSFTVSDNN
ncbi:right-handed parallel beta-helix repeat-containing protein [Streptomyces shenzhenensis]|uniref:right-handed parallel beta-helix repeat-containing protein n=1 Tax=Streptomyces shenzhenensis TaxID=943815 RepID=UPI0015EFEED1|nr:right-handed parallel beta-helix repeat-containing protein [Streptomyces shenzhenensis]